MLVNLYFPCEKCKGLTGQIEKSSMHNKLICAECLTFIKFIKNSDLNLYSEITCGNKETLSNNSIMVYLEEIHFKLDLILTHLNIMERK